MHGTAATDTRRKDNLGPRRDGSPQCNPHCTLPHIMENLS